jgi:hypothetical protein
MPARPRKNILKDLHKTLLMSTATACDPMNNCTVCAPSEPCTALRLVMVDGTGRERSRAGVDEEGARVLTAGIRRLWDPSLFTLTVQIAQKCAQATQSSLPSPERRRVSRKSAIVTGDGEKFPPPTQNHVPECGTLKVSHARSAKLSSTWACPAYTGLVNDIPRIFILGLIKYAPRSWGLIKTRLHTP